MKRSPEHLESVLHDLLSRPARALAAVLGNPVILVRYLTSLWPETEPERMEPETEEAEEAATLAGQVQEQVAALTPAQREALRAAVEEVSLAAAERLETMFPLSV